jgi:hypothetical protein
VRLPVKLRRPLAFAFLLALVLIVGRTCEGESVSADIEFDAGPAGSQLRRLRADLYRPGETDGVGYFEAAFPRGSGARIGPWTLTADAGDYRLVIELTTDRGVHRLERSVHLRDRARVVVDVARTLAP